jgi:ribosomal protein S12 methylthiotransferase accessory factor
VSALRQVPAETTLAHITPHLASFGITRLADVTRLDELGVPVYCAIRPTARTVQVSNGKGLTVAQAKVSALMEAIELHHAENLRALVQHSSLAELEALGLPRVHPEELPGFRRDLHFDDRCRIEWVRGESLADGAPIWLPASAAYHRSGRSLYHWTSTGLASGNQLTEATLYALYEVLERHCLSLLVEGGEIRFDAMQVIDPGSLPSGALGGLVEKIAAAGVELKLLRLNAPLDVHTFMAVLCDPQPFGLPQRIDAGYASHLDPAAAAIRAITEAAQGRLSAIHGSREDLPHSAYAPGAHAPLYRFFSQLEPDSDFATLSSRCPSSLDEQYAAVLAATAEVGLDRAYRVELTAESPLPISVVKLLVPGALDCFPV